MEFIFILVASIVLSIVFFSSGITIFNSTHLGFIKGAGKANRSSRWISEKLLFMIDATGRVRRAWIRMISPRSEL